MDRQDFIPVEREAFPYSGRCERGAARERAAASCERGTERDSACERDEGTRGRALAMAYVPMQRFRALYCPEEGLRAGTLFRELDKPFTGRCKRRCDHA